MAHALESPAECEILKTHADLTFNDGKYRYRIERVGGRSFYSVTDGQDSIRVPIGWAFGLGSAGQTYVFENGGNLYESRVSFYQEANGLRLTIGAANQAPKDLREAAGRAFGAEDSRCFACHATDATIGSKLTLERMIPGIQCERCHGPSDGHVGNNNSVRPVMKSLRGMSAEDTSNFCGQCHRTWDEIAGAGTQGIANIRFQPYRLTNSKCYDSDDSRIRCTACHDPHGKLQTAEASYDRKCQACHAGGKPSARACKVSNANCVSCHMPKIELPGAYHRFTDHQIRIVRAGASYPN